MLDISPEMFDGVQRRCMTFPSPAMQHARRDLSIDLLKQFVRPAAANFHLLRVTMECEVVHDAENLYKAVSHLQQRDKIAVKSV